MIKVNINNMRNSLLFLIIIVFGTFSVIKSYQTIPNTDFTGNDLGNAGSATNAATSCNNDVTCVGYTSGGWYKYDINTPTYSSGYNTYVHETDYGGKFFNVLNFDIAGNDISSFIATDVSNCVYKCTITSGCIATVFRVSDKYCWLKKAYVQPTAKSGQSFLIPTGLGGCPVLHINDGTCISPMSYNKIPNFDFNGADSTIGQATSLDSAKSLCDPNSACIGFNSASVYKKSVGSPYLLTSGYFLVHSVVSNTKFVVLPGWDVATSTNLAMVSGSSPSDCATRCKNTLGCAGAITDQSNKCYLKSYYIAPNKNVNRVMLMPVTNGGSCPSNTIDIQNNLLCTFCPNGQVSLYGPGLCINCLAGQSSSLGGLCLPCPAGQSSVAGGTCTSCSSGQTSISGGLCSNCPNGYISNSGDSSCSISIPYNVLPSIDFTGNDIGYIQPLSTTESTCESDATCIGFNSAGYSKNDFKNPVVASASNFYIHFVAYGMQFARVTGLKYLGNVIGTAYTGATYTETYCAFLCTTTAGCVGVSWDQISGYRCSLLSTFVAPSSDVSYRMLLPVGKGNCPLSIINAGNCIFPIPYNVLPSIDFTGNDIGYIQPLSTTESTCESDATCIGFNSAGYYKNDFKSPVVASASNFYVHFVAYGMQFVQLLGYNALGNSIVSYTGSQYTQSYCAYLCSVTTGCAGVVWSNDTSNNVGCVLKSSFTSPNPKTNMVYYLLLPTGRGGCPISMIGAGNCINPTPYNIIPKFDFSGNNIALATSIDNAEKSCETASRCIGFNSALNYKTDFGTAAISTTIDTFVHTVSYGMQFLQVKGFNNAGATISLGNLYSPSSSVCVYYCTTTPGCVGAVWKLATSTCTLKSNFVVPNQDSNYNMLIPVGKAGCSTTVVNTGNCITPAPICPTYLPGASLMSLLIYAEPKFLQLSINLANDPLNQDLINTGKSFLLSFLTTEVDFNGDQMVTTQEVIDALKFRSVEAIGLSSNMNVWNCRSDSNGCNGTYVNKTRINKDALNCYTYSPKHRFDCSGVSIIKNLYSDFPKSDDNKYCQKSDQAWYPTKYHKPYTNWTYTPSSTPTGQSNIGTHGKVCIYSNGLVKKILFYNY